MDIFMYVYVGPVMNYVLNRCVLLAFPVCICMFLYVCIHMRTGSTGLQAGGMKYEKLILYAHARAYVYVCMQVATVHI